MNAYLVRVAIAFDVFCNVILYGNQDETMSSRAGRAAKAGKLWGRILAGALNYCFPNHCQDAELHDEWRARYIVKIESGEDK
jgi:hypothetical protein